LPTAQPSRRGMVLDLLLMRVQVQVLQVQVQC
jgi:hypothetical protein